MQRFVDYKLTAILEELVLNAKDGTKAYAKIAKTASLTNYVSTNSPAFLLLHGKPDCIVPLGQAECFQKELDKHHEPSELVLLDNAEQAFSDVVYFVLYSMVEYFQFYLI